MITLSANIIKNSIHPSNFLEIFSLSYRKPIRVYSKFEINFDFPLNCTTFAFK